jgi:hypothetical protein
MSGIDLARIQFFRSLPKPSSKNPLSIREVIFAAAAGAAEIRNVKTQDINLGWRPAPVYRLQPCQSRLRRVFESAFS